MEKTLDTRQTILDRLEQAPATVKLGAGAVGIGVGFVDHIVYWAQVFSVLGGALIVAVTLFGMAVKGYRWLRVRLG